MTEHPLTTDEIRANAGKWTLAGDVGLLAHLKQFSEVIIQKAEATESSLNNLLDQVEETTTNFNNVSNQFLSLQNSQFVENRVYDDETPTEDKEQIPQSIEETQQQTLDRYKEAVSIGLDLLDSHFEEVDILESSDSDEETSGSNPALVLRPKSKYNKPLPLIIGSAEWWTDDNVGLAEFQENEDTEPDATLSESEPDVIRPQVEKRLIRSLSSSSVSSLEEIPEAKKPTLPAIITIPAEEEPPVLPTNDEDDGEEDMFKPVDDLFGYVQERSKQNNLFESRGYDQGNLFEPSSDDLFQPKPVEKTTSEDLFKKEEVQPKPVANKISNAFTKELVAKLGSVAKNQEVKPDILPKIENQLPVAKTRTLPVKPNKPLTEVKTVPEKPKSKGLFGEEDEDYDDLFSGVASKKSTVSNVRAKESAPSKLFDDEDDDDLFANVKKKDASTEKKQSVASTYDFTAKPAATAASSNLFSGFEDDLDESNLFAPKTVPQSVPKMFPGVRVSAVDSMDNSPTANVVKTSTPALQAANEASLDENPSDDLFGSISRVADESREQSVVNDESSNFEHDSQIAPNPADVAMMNDTRDESRDLGFTESSSIGGDNSSKKDMHGNWFHPQLSSTRAVGVSSHDTSGFKTGTVHESESPSDGRPREKGLSSILEDNSNPVADKVKDDLFSGPSGKSSNWRNVVDDSDDLFSGSLKPAVSPTPPSRHVKIESDLFQSDAEDLFAIKPKNPVEKKVEIAPVKTSSWKPSLLFDDEEEDNSLFDDGKPKLPDNVSVSSSRSSLFDEPAIPGKSTLPSIFEKKGESPAKGGFKVSLFEDVDDDFDLFGKKTKDVKKEDDDKLFMAKPVKQEGGGKPTEIIKESSRPKPPTTLGVTKTSDLLNDEPDGEAIKAVPKKIGKINIPINLKINPAALLPGMKPAKPNRIEEPEVAPTPIIITESTQDIKTPPTSPGVLISAGRDRPRIQVKRRPQSRKARHDALRNSGIDFGGSDTTPTPTPVSDTDKESSNSIFHSIENSPSTAFASATVMSPSTDEEDYFNVPELDSHDKEEQNIFKNKVTAIVENDDDDDSLFGGAAAVSPKKDETPKQLFGGSAAVSQKKEETPKPLFGAAAAVSPKKDETPKSLFGGSAADSPKKEEVPNSLFGGAAAVSPKKEEEPEQLFGAVATVKKDETSKPNIPIDTSKPSKSTLFNQLSEDDDLFGASAAKNSSTDVIVPKKPAITKPKTISLFDDDDEDDDIFSGNASKAVIEKPKKTPVPKPIVEKEVKPFVDPLGLLHDQD